MRTTIRMMIAAILMMAALFVTSLAFAQEGDTISYDQIVSGEITEEQLEVRYTFNGEANDTITISMRATEPGLDSYLRLLNAAGDELIFDDDAGGSLNSLIGPYTIPETGAYTVVATRCCGGGPGGSTGPFELVIQHAEVASISVGETVTVQLSEDNTFANYFIASDGDGQILRIDGNVTTENTNFSMNVRNPHGEYVGWGAVYPNRIAAIEPLILREAGSYVLNLRYEPLGDASDAANLPVVVDVTLETLEAQPFAFGEAQNGVLSDETPAFWYTFAADQSDLLRLVASMQADDQPFEVQFFDSRGQGFYSGSNAYGEDGARSFTLDPIQLNESGQYLFVIRRVDTTGMDAMGTTHFMFTLSQTETPILQSGVEATGAVGGQSYEQVFRFEGQAGQTIRITLRNINQHYAPSMDVTGPRSEVEETAYNLGIGGGGGGIMGLVLNLNSGLPATNIHEVTLQIDGTYLFRVRNGAPYMPMEMQPEGPLPEQPMGEFGLTVEVTE
jgi:hypothetical protein